MVAFYGGVDGLEGLWPSGIWRGCDLEDLLILFQVGSGALSHFQTFANQRCADYVNLNL